jgi:hypothetical protein
LIVPVKAVAGAAKNSRVEPPDDDDDDDDDE